MRDRLEEQEDTGEHPDQSCASQGSVPPGLSGWRWEPKEERHVQRYDYERASARPITAVGDGAISALFLALPASSLGVSRSGLAIEYRTHNARSDRIADWPKSKH